MASAVDQVEQEELGVSADADRAATPSEPSQQAVSGKAGITDAEDVLRELASYVGAGGYNAETVDPAVFAEKIRWGVDHIVGVESKDARRYRKLRSLGVAPGGTRHLEDGLVLVATNLDQWVDDYLERGIAPAPSEAVEYGARYCSSQAALVSALEEIAKIEARYRSQMKFCDIEPLPYFREFTDLLHRTGYATILAKIGGAS
jgi:hypothetical protein